MLRGVALQRATATAPGRAAALVGERSPRRAPSNRRKGPGWGYWSIPRVTARTEIVCMAAVTEKVPWSEAPWASGGSGAPPDIYGIGLNYLSHAKELGRDPPPAPLVFPKAASSFCTDPYLILPDPKVEGKVDYEVELGVVIGPGPCRNVSESEAMKYVYGYVVANDVSGRHCQFEAAVGGQWSLSKSFDTFCSVQEGITLAHTVAEVDALDMTATINGEVVQAGSTADLIFKVPKIIAHLSRSTTLLPGTLILTGTPPGPGHFKKPPQYLQPGDVITMEISSLGSFTQTVKAASEASN